MAQANGTHSALSADIHLLGDLLGTIIREQHGDAALNIVEDVRGLAKARRSDDLTAHGTLDESICALDLATKRVLIKAFGTYFQLINIAEDQQRIRVLRERELTGSLRESIPAAVAHLREAGVTAAELRAHLDQIGVRLVLTAHPTEAKRQEILIKLRHIAELMHFRATTELLPHEDTRLAAELAATIEGLWQTRLTRAVRTTVADEVEFGIYFITSVIMDVLLDITADLRAALETHYPAENWSDLPPLLRFASWIGGDRDGHPHVTPDVTLTTIETLRAAARRVYLAEISFLRDHLTQSRAEIPVSHELLDALRTIHPDAPPPDEPYRAWLDVIADRLQNNVYRRSVEFAADLRVLADSLRAHQGQRVAAGAVQRLLQKVALFGLHLVTLEVRQDARLHAQAIGEILEHYEICADYANLPEDEKQANILCELVNPRPLFPVEPQFSDTTNLVIATWRMIAGAINAYGPRVIDTHIASMCTAPSDVLVMLLFAKEVGIASHLDLVPLFETVDDLNNAPAVMQTLFEIPEYRDYLTTRGSRQQIMIGYSDSSKDGGYLASNWGLYRAQQELGTLCAESGIQVELFHGRGGSIGRGGGPTNRAILAQAPSAMQGRIKMTEQGEVIAYRYSNAAIARRHLQQVMHAVLIATCSPNTPDVLPEWRDAMTILAEVSRAAYRAFVYGNPGFLDYWHAATPIGEISKMPIGSRPAKRGAGGFGQVRAIPWVFSWMQSRAIIPSWYGVGLAFDHYCALDDCEGEGLERLQTMYQDWPFFRALIKNTEMDLAKADMGIAALYADLVADEALRERIWQSIADEHELACAYVNAVTGSSVLLEQNSVMRRSIDRRNPYVDPLNFIQVSLLRDLRALDPTAPDYADTLRAVLETVNGIAAGMKTTG